MGSFQMGAQSNELRRPLPQSGVDAGPGIQIDTAGLSWADELPRHHVVVDVPIAMGRTEVTYDQWMACVDDGGCNGYVPFDQGARGVWLRGEHPVMRMSQEDALSYIKWLNTKVETGTYRLPTEAEWEYAARAGTETRFAQGDKVTPMQANFSGAITQLVEQRLLPHLIDRSNPVVVEELDAANPWGLRHMSGNVSEFTRSCYTKSYSGWPRTSKWLEKSTATCEEIVHRGGSYTSPMDGVRVARRGKIAPHKRAISTGFRIMKQLDRQ